MSSRCDECGRFVRETRDVWGPLQSSGPDHGACARCKPELFEEEYGYGFDGSYGPVRHGWGRTVTP